ncbi:beta-N-acetylhexosaminidase [Zafaria cholistanensis]|uniref:beta-N-acetylhexosaminidase n=1 Tax=Zafaria cholistanensis TaxID=1682741 RepID=A0A5A7NNV6_9MICC|nr:beta-N-acetylhexosaminidase [Zafaria cholistanensis]
MQSSDPAQDPPTGWGPLASDAAAARAAVAQMDLEEKAGQVLVDHYSGTDPEAQLALARKLHLGGVMIMGGNVPTTGTSAADTDKLARVVAGFQKVLSDGRDWPGIVAVDQEGGMVQRLKQPLTEWPAPMALGAAGDPALTRRAQAAMDAELARLGFTMNFSPVADVTTGASDPTIGSRSFGDDPDAVAGHTVAALAGALDAGVLPAVKHFPGHGSVATDSHVGLPVQESSLRELSARDWVPFRDAVKAGAPMVMMGHVSVPELEEGVPASLSAASYRALEGLGFSGVAVTDALNMGAVTASYPQGRAAVEALRAGADLLLMPQAIAPAHAAIVEAVRSGEVPAARLDEAAAKVGTMMLWQQRLAASASASAPASGEASGEGPDRPRVPPAAPGAGRDVGLEAARSAVTVVTGKCDGALVSGKLRIEGGTPQDRARLRTAAGKAGLDVAGSAASSGKETLVRLLGSGTATGTGDIVVALDAPWGLAGSTARTARIALYGRTPESFAALADVLAGKAEAPGKLPAGAGRYPRGAGCP